MRIQECKLLCQIEKTIIKEILEITEIGTDLNQVIDDHQLQIDHLEDQELEAWSELRY